MRPMHITPHARRLAAGTAVLLAGIATAHAAEYSEAPALAERVEAGDLPPVAERLPAEPEIVEPMGSVGQYGGDIRRALRGGADHNSILRIVGAQSLVRWEPDWSGIRPNLAKSWEVNEDATEYTVHLREGLRWSDGHPFTADDLVFFVEDLLHNEEFYAGSPPARFVVGDEPMTIEKHDDYSVTYKFAAPYGMFLQEHATPLGQHPTLYAKHYCQQFHPDYNDNLEPLLDEYNTDEWPDLFRQTCGDIEIPTRWGNPDRPTMDPWVVTEPYVGGATQVILERNPYFWQVDPEGNQLPYVDRIVNNIVQDHETILLQAINGEIDLQSRHLDVMGNIPVLFENMEDGGYELYELQNASSNAMVIQLNLTHKDPATRELFNDYDFRRAISHAIDREEIIDIVFLGQGEPWQIGPRPEHDLYHEQLGRQFTEFDLDLANEILDEAGYTERDDDGYRLMPNGERIFLNVEVSLNNPHYIDVLELIEPHWQEIGVELNIDSMERSIFYERGIANDQDIATWGAPGGLDPYLSPRMVVAVHPIDSRYAVPWAEYWVSGGKRGEEPKPSMQERQDLYDQFLQTADEAKQAEIFTQILDIAAEEFEVIGITLAPNFYGVRNADLQNVMSPMPNAWMYLTPAPALPQQMYYED